MPKNSKTIAANNKKSAIPIPMITALRFARNQSGTMMNNANPTAIGMNNIITMMAKNITLIIL